MLCMQIESFPREISPPVGSHPRTIKIIKSCALSANVALFHIFSAFINLPLLIQNLRMVSVRMTEQAQSQFHTCGLRIAPGEDGQLPTSNLESPPGGHGPPRMAMRKGTFWRNGTHIKVAFMGDTNIGNEVISKDASQFVKDKVIEKANIWEVYANIKFDFVQMTDNPDIRVAFGPDKGSWSYLGTQCRSIDKRQPTMNFGWFTDRTEDDEFERVAVHEFGHALGCTHELQSPAAGTIQWDREKVYDYYLRTNGWKRPEVDAQVLTQDDPSLDIDTMFDATSIMCYPIPPGLTKNGLVIGWNIHLSPIDEDFIGKVYPKRTHDAGEFSTNQLPQRDLPNNLNTMEVTFQPPYLSPPKFAYGLSAIYMSGEANIRIAAAIDQVTLSSCQVHVDTWNDSKLNAAAVSWVETSDAGKYQMGIFDTKTIYKFGEIPEVVTEHIIFNSPFDSEKPTVLLFLKGLDMAKERDWNVSTSVAKVSNSGFDITVTTPGTPNGFGTIVSWLAFPSSTPAVCGGNVNTGTAKGGNVAFPKGKFPQGSPPGRVMVALNGIAFGHGKDLKIKVYADEITQDGFVWHVESGVDSLWKGAGFSWIAQ
jgi:hypothetical protein